LTAISVSVIEPSTIRKTRRSFHAAGTSSRCLQRPSSTALFFS